MQEDDQYVEIEMFESLEELNRLLNSIHDLHA